MSIRPLQPAQQQAVINTLELATELTSDGCSASEAIAKAASQNGMPHNLLQYLVNAFNNGVSQVPIKSGKTREDKAVQVDLARVEEVEKHLYGDGHKSAAVSSDYSKLPSVLLRDIAPPTVRKQANVTREALPVLQEGPENTRDLPHLSTIADYKRAFDEARSNVNMEFIQYKRAQAGLQSYLQDHRHLAKDELQEQAIAAFGPLAEVVIGPLHDDAAGLKKRGRAQVVRIDREPFSLVKQAITHLEALEQLGNAYSNKFHQTAAYLKQAKLDHPESAGMIGMIERQLGMSVKVSKPVRPTPVDYAAYENGRRLLNDEVVDKSAAMAQASTPVPMAATPLGKPKISANDIHEINSIHGASSLNNLMLSSPDLMGYQPEAVARAFNEIRTAYPDIANNPAAIRPYLQRHLAAGGLDEFAGKNLADTAAKHQQSMNPPGVR